MTESRVPSKVGNGGAGTLSIDAELSQSSFLAVDFRGAGVGHVNAHEDLQPGRYSWNVELAPGTGGSVRLEAKSPTPGAKLHWVVKYNGLEVIDQEGSLEHPLGSGESFFLGVDKDDFTKISQN